MDELELLNDFDSIYDSGGDAPERVSRRANHADRTPVKGEITPDTGKETPEDNGGITPDNGGQTPEKETDSGPLMMHDLADEEKPREKALREGINSLTDVELLALLLGSGIPGKSVLDLSREILRDNDNRLAYLSRKSIPEIMRKYKGMGTAKATLLVAAMTFGARAQADLQIQDPQMSSSQAVYSFMRTRLERLNNEEFWVLHLSRANRIQSVEQISKGGLTHTTVDVKLIVKSAIDRLSAGIILIHNHPSGNLVPSGPDDTLTKRITEVCKLVEVPVLDHIIIGPTGYYSYRDQGRL